MSAPAALRARSPVPPLAAGALVASLLGLSVALGGRALTLGTAAGALMMLAAAAYLAYAVHPAVLMSGAVVLGVFAGHWQLIGIPGAIAPDRWMMVAAIGSVILRSPWMARRPAIRLRGVHVLMMSLVLFVVLHVILEGGFASRSDVFVLTDRFGVIPYLGFVVAPFAFASPRSRDALLVALVVLGAYLGYLALMSALHADALVLPPYVGDAIASPNARAVGPFLEPASNGFALFAGGIGALIAMRRWRAPEIRAVCALVAVLCAAGLLFTVTRQVWAGAVLGTLVAMTAFWELRRLLVGVAVVGVLGVIVAFAVVPGLSDRVRARSNEQGTVWDRQNQVNAALRMIDARPLTGFGWQRFQFESRDYYRQADDYPLVGTRYPVHNVVLGYAAELGLFAAAAWTAVLLIGVGGALLTRGPPELRPWRMGLVALFCFYLVMAMFEPVNSYPNLLLWMWAGVVLAGSARLRPYAA